MNRYHVCNRNLDVKYRLHLVSSSDDAEVVPHKLQIKFYFIVLIIAFCVIDSGGMPDRSVTLTGLPESIQ